MINRLYVDVDENSEFGNAVKKLKEKNQDALINKVIDNENQNLMVTPKEIDNVITHISKVISNGINLALHPDIDLEYIESFIF